jgi:signal transduction histidine kinase
VERLKNLALELLDLGGKRRFVFVAADPEQPAREVLDSLEARARTAGVELEGEFKAGDTPFVMAPEGVHECLFNLALNAIEAFPSPERRPPELRPRVVVGVSRTEEAGMGACPRYTVRDNGPGFSNAGERDAGDHSANFESGKQGGSGIGLFATRKTAREMGAELSFFNLPEGGVEAVLALSERKI